MKGSLRLSVVAVLLLSVPATGTAQDQKELQKCDKPVGTLAVNEPQSQYMAIFQRYQLGSPASLLRIMAQQSNCFVVLERGVGMQNMQQERALARSGEMQQDANMGGGMMKAADFVLTAAILVDNPNAGGAGAAVGGLLGRRIGGLAGGLKFKEAETSILVSDARTSVQVASGQGKARQTDFSLGALSWGGGLAAAGGGYTNTAEGKVIAASYLDNYNNIVTTMKANPELMARADKFKAAGLSGADVKTGATYAEGDVLVPKIDNIKLLAEAKDGAKVVATLKGTSKMVFMGTEENGFLKVQGSDAEGWVKKSLVKK
jgi:hypothetical protein